MDRSAPVRTPATGGGVLQRPWPATRASARSGQQWPVPCLLQVRSIHLAVIVVGLKDQDGLVVMRHAYFPFTIGAGTRRNLERPFRAKRKPPVRASGLDLRMRHESLVGYSLPFRERDEEPLVRFARLGERTLMLPLERSALIGDLPNRRSRRCRTWLDRLAVPGRASTPPACFAALLGGPATTGAGSIRPHELACRAARRRRYRARHADSRNRLPQLSMASSQLIRFHAPS